MFHEFPKWVYHKEENAKIVETKEEQDALGKGWQETPFKVTEKQDEKAKESQASETKEIEATGNKSETSEGSGLTEAFEEMNADDADLEDPKTEKKKTSKKKEKNK